MNCPLIKRYSSILALFGILALMLCACSSGSDTSTISISLGVLPSQGRAAVSIDQLVHTIMLSGPSGNQTMTISGSGTAKATVVAGVWNIRVEAYFEKELYALGSATAEVKAGRNTDVLIQMTVVLTEPETKRGTGGGGGSSSGGTSPQISVTIIPAAVTVLKGDTFQFNATVDNSQDQNVTWTVSGGLSNIDGIGLLGVSMSETTGAQLTVTARSVADNTKSGTAVVTVAAASGSGTLTTITINGDLWVNAELEPDTSALSGITGYEWKKNGTAMSPPETGSKYIVKSFDKNQQITVTIAHSEGSTDSLPVTIENKTGIYEFVHLDDIRSDLAGNYILQTNAINFDSDIPGGFFWEPIGSNGNGFSGSFDGSGNTINLGSNKIDLKLDSITYYASLFLNISGGEVKNLKLEGSINASISDRINAAALAGDFYGTIENVCSNVDITVDGTFTLAGGIVAFGAGDIRNCYSTGNITANSSSWGSQAGGISGDHRNGQISNCWVEGDVNVSLTFGDYAGGIAGSLAEGGEAAHCVALNNVIGGSSSTDVGRITGSLAPAWSPSPPNGTVSSNFANGVMTTASHAPIDDPDDIDGKDVDLATEANTLGWWNTTSPAGPGWSVGTKAAADEANPWYWGAGNRPRLWFE